MQQCIFLTETSEILGAQLLLFKAIERHTSCKKEKCYFLVADIQKSKIGNQNMQVKRKIYYDN